MCGSSHKPPPPPPPPAPPPVNPPPTPNVLEVTKRSDSSSLTAMRGRSSLRIDRASGTLGGGSGNGLNIPS